MRFSVFIVLSVLSIATLATGAVAASPQPTATGTDSSNATATPTASTPTAAPAPTTSSPTATDGGGQDLGDELRNGSLPNRPNVTVPNVTVPNRPNITVNVTVPDRGGSSTPTATPSEPARDAPDAENETGTRIDSGTVILSSEYQSGRNMTSIVIKSERPQTVTISDAGHFSLGGVVPAREQRMQAGDQMRFELASRKVNGEVALSISTRETPVYAHYIERGGDGLDILRALSSLQAWGAGVLVMLTWQIIGALSVLRQEDGSPRRASL